MEGYHACTDIRVGSGIVDGKPVGNAIHLGLGLRNSHIGPKSPDDVPPGAAAKASLIFGKDLRCKHLAFTAGQAEFEVRRQHANDRVRLCVECERPSNKGWIRPEPTSPQPVRQDDNGPVTTFEFLRKKRAAVGSRDPERFEEPVGHQRHQEDLWLLATCEIERQRLDRRHVVIALRLFPPIEEICRGDVVRLIPVLRIGLPDGDDSIGLGKRQRLQ